ncbi:hypothetical protein OC861_002901 [Tilletia horrida]|nr:hypothetical protein OC861_002901 [Tilletia horrida]
MNAHSPARSTASTSTSSSFQPASSSRLRPSLAPNSELAHKSSTPDRYRMDTRRTGSAASFSSARSCSSRSSQYESEIQLEDTPTLQLALGALAPRPPTGHHRTGPSPGVVPAFLVISIINHILFARGALDIPLKLEPLLHGPVPQPDSHTGRGRAHSMGSGRTVGTSSKNQGRQSKLVPALHRLHADLCRALDAVYHAGSKSATGEAIVSVLVSFGSSPLLPKEYLHITLRLSGVPPRQNTVATNEPKSTESRSPKSSSVSTDSYFTATSSPPTADPQSPLTPVDYSSPAPPTVDQRPLLKACTALQRKALRFVVSEDSLQPETFSRKLQVHHQLRRNRKKRALT